MDNTPEKEEVVDYSSKIKRKNAQPDAQQTQAEALDDGMCIRCGKNHHVDGDLYCSGCIAELHKTKPPVLAWIFAFLVSVAAAGAVFMTLVNFSSAKRIIEARIAMSEHRIEDAYNAYDDAFAVADELNEAYGFTIDTISNRIRIEQAEAVAKMYMPVYSYSFLSQYYTDEQMQADPAMRKILNYYNDYNAAYEVVGPYVNAVEEKSMTVEEAVSAIRAKEADFKDNKDRLFWVLYVEAYVSSMYSEPSLEDQLAFADRMSEMCPEQEWYYHGIYRNLYFSLGRYDECLEACKKEVEFDRNAPAPYYTKLKIAFINESEEAAYAIMDEYYEANGQDDDYNIMNVMTLRRFGYVDEAAQACEEAIASGDGAPELYRQKAINCLVTGDYTAAFDSVYNSFASAYNIAQYGGSKVLTTEILQTTYIIAMLYKEKGDGLAENHAELAALLDSLGDYSTIISENSQQVLAGEKTVLQVLAEGTGDLV